MSSDLITVRKMTCKDLLLVYKWRDDLRIRKNMFNSDKIDRKNHDLWFEKSTSDPTRYLLLVCRANVPFGFAQFNTRPCKAVADWGFYVDPDGAKGQGTILGQYILNYAFEEIGLRRVHAEVLNSNSRSLALHTRLGFVCEGILRQHHKKNDVYQDVSLFGLLVAEWKSSNLSKIIK
jgi:UDP-4-amino-4,6-dideoxy-N-acetyl-beta-L-altrosamine N-acetyltransferase